MSSQGTKVGAPYPYIQLRDYPAYKPVNTIQETTGTAIFSTFIGISLAALRGALAPSNNFWGGIKANTRLIWLARMYYRRIFASFDDWLGPIDLLVVVECLVLSVDIS